MDNQNKKPVDFAMYGIVFGFISGAVVSFIVKGMSLEYSAVLGMAIGWFVGKSIKRKDKK